MTRLLCLVVVLLSFACSSPEQVAVVDQTPATLASVHLPNDLYTDIQDPEVLGILQWAIGRWNHATGDAVQMRIVYTSEPLHTKYFSISLLDIPRQENDEFLVGGRAIPEKGKWNLILNSRVFQDDLYYLAPRVVLHELGHSLGVYEHTEHGLMSLFSDTDCIDAFVIDDICTRYTCTTRRPTCPK